MSQLGYCCEGSLGNLAAKVATAGREHWSMGGTLLIRGGADILASDTVNARNQKLVEFKTALSYQLHCKGWEAIIADCQNGPDAVKFSIKTAPYKINAKRIFWVCYAAFSDRFNRIKYRCVILAAEFFTDALQGKISSFPYQRHSDLPRPRDMTVLMDTSYLFAGYSKLIAHKRDDLGYRSAGVEDAHFIPLAQAPIVALRKISACAKGNAVNARAITDYAYRQFCDIIPGQTFIFAGVNRSESATSSSRYGWDNDDVWRNTSAAEKEQSFLVQEKPSRPSASIYRASNTIRHGRTRNATHPSRARERRRSASAKGELRRVRAVQAGEGMGHIADSDCQQSTGTHPLDQACIFSARSRDGRRKPVRRLMNVDRLQPISAAAV